MHTSTPHQTRLRLVFETEWSRLAAANPAIAHADTSPMLWLAEELLGELASDDAYEADTLTGRVRKRVIDREFVGETGDVCMDPHYRVPLDVEVRLITVVISRVLEMHDHVHVG